MPAKSEKQRKFMGAVMSYKKGNMSKSEASEEVEDAAKSMSKTQVKDYLKKESESKKSKSDSEEVNETTSSASSGAYQTPFPTNMINNKPTNMINNKPTNENITITIGEIENIVKKTLMYEAVYSEKAKLTHSAAKGKSVGKKPDNGAETFAKKSGEESRKNATNVKTSTEGSVKQNLKDSKPIDVNKKKLQNDDQRIEAQQGGMQDLEYDHITPEDKARFKKYALGKKTEKGDNSVESKVNQQIMDDAKKRKDSKNKNLLNTPMVQHGSTIFLLPDAKQKTRNIAYENTNKMKRYNFKESFTNEKQMISKIPSKAKVPMNIFEMTDGDAKYKVRWEGDDKSGCAVILEGVNTVEDKKIMENLSKVNTFKSQTTKSSNINEHKMLKNILDIARDYE